MKILPVILVAWLMWSAQATAVQHNPRGLGEVLIYPYYTVNNQLNFLYSVVNTTDEAKVIKVSFHEGDAGLKVLDFHVYLSSYDVWTGVLGAMTSTVVNHVDEPSVIHATGDHSCAPYLIKSGQEFLPFVIDTDADPDNRSMNRAREGYMQVIELGVLTGVAVAHVDPTNTGVPSNCAAIQAAWDTAEWQLSEPDEPSGGLTGGASIINVYEGLSVSYDATALNQFWEGPGLFTAPGEALPDLGSGSNQSQVLLENGELATAEWSSGIEAVSAVLMKAQLHNEYSHDAIVNGKSEWVLSFPTKGVHTRLADGPLQPFANAWDGRQSCDAFSAMIVDRSQQSLELNLFPDPTPPAPVLPELCQAINVLEFLPDGAGSTGISAIFGSDNTTYYEGLADQRVTENGWALLSFAAEEHAMVPVTGTGLKGLPVTGFMVQQFTNAGASAGLLAQYANLFKHTGRVQAIGDE